MALYVESKSMLVELTVWTTDSINSNGPLAGPGIKLLKFAPEL